MDQQCLICAQDVPGTSRKKIYSMGKCNHHVCYVCSARLRVICDQFECPICREKLDHVVFTSNKKPPFERYSTKDCLFSDKYKIYFESKAIKSAFDKLLQYECLECLKSSQESSGSGGTNADTSKGNKQKQNNKTKSHESNQVSGGNDGTTTSTNKTNTTSNSNSSPNAPPPNNPSSKDNKSNSKTTNSNSSNNNNVKTSRDTNRTASPSVQSNNGSNNINNNNNNNQDTAKRIEEDAQGLLEPADVIISHTFSDVFGLKNHLNYVHKLRLCDLCLFHNKLFPFEYSYYDDTALRRHVREGEPNTSHRGHPRCALCHRTFFNTDELIRHMSVEHYHCHLCNMVNPDSNMRMYFLDYNSLREHFKRRHFLCERDNCRHEQFTSAFDSRLNYELHLVQVHGDKPSPILLESTPHRSSGRATSPNSPRRPQDCPRGAAIVSTGTIATANNLIPTRRLIRPQRLPAASDFPTLGQNVAGSALVNNHFGPSSRGVPVQIGSVENFPQLPQQQQHSSPNRSSQNQRQQQQQQQQLISFRPQPSTLSQRMTAGSSSVYARPPDQLSDMDFPPLPEAPRPAKAKGNKNQGNKNQANKNQASKSQGGNNKKAPFKGRKGK